MLAIVAIGLLTIVAVTILARSIAKPLGTVGRAMHQVAEGALDERVASAGLREIDGLSESFNTMACALEQRSDALHHESSERSLAEERIRYLAYHDDLTGLPNRALLKERLSRALDAATGGRVPLALLYVDLDNFKLVNDAAGHSCGDELLTAVSDRILASIRVGDTVARVGGDEYVLLLPAATAKVAMQVAERVRESLHMDWEREGRAFSISASLGVALYPDHGRDAETLLRNADTAMYAAKSQGRDRIRQFSPAMDASVQQRVELEEGLRRAISEEQFVVHYQPQVSTRSGQIVGVEALVRWQRPGRGLVLPDEFIGVAEETDLIWDIGHWVLHTACEQLRRFIDAGLASGMTMAVNVSARQFHDPRMVDIVSTVLDETGLPSDLLDLEITESTAMRDAEHTERTLGRLKRMGVRVSIDDFGTGYSSLSYLKRFPVDTVKIDRSFVRDISEDADDAAIVGAIIALASSLNMSTVAEGVETPQQLEFLTERRCDAYQGHLYTAPVAGSELADLLDFSRRQRRSSAIQLAPVIQEPRAALAGCA